MIKSLRALIIDTLLTASRSGEKAFKAFIINGFRVLFNSFPKHLLMVPSASYWLCYRHFITHLDKHLIGEVDYD
jgi:sRNA-binding regulator protein Hfq